MIPIILVRGVSEIYPLPLIISELVEGAKLTPDRQKKCGTAHKYSKYIYADKLKITLTLKDLQNNLLLAPGYISKKLVRGFIEKTLEPELKRFFKVSLEKKLDNLESISGQVSESESLDQNLTEKSESVQK